ncbi:CdaR family protein [Lachnoclostridium phocaeense]|uniref:CdaR family protein n=1 Tax=Lachnoclostridium phocaeense TaxID=1871021 RepID=UPI00248E92EA|nr:CdaR family protein [Lachnoclostridium phocaeense]
MKKSLTNNIGLKLLAFLFAFMLWLLVVNIDDPVDTKTFDSIPVTIEHAEVVTQDQRSYQVLDGTDTVSVTVSATRSVLEKISAENIVATADMRELYLESQIPIEITIPGYEFESATANPRNVQVKIEQNKSDTFPITVTTTGTVRDGYVLGNVQADPERVTVNGPESVIDRISKVVAQVNVSGLSEDSSIDAVLTYYDSDNNEISAEQLANNLGTTGVKVNVTLYHTARIPVTVDTSGVTAADGYSISEVTWTPEEIQLAGEEEVLDALESIRIPADAVDITSISQRTEQTVDITPYLPEGTRLVDENGNNILVTARVAREGTKSFDIPVGSITVDNLSDSLSVSGYGSGDDLEVHIGGPQEQLNSLQLSDLAVSIDLKDCTKAGDYEVPVTITLPSDAADCTVETSVTVTVTLQERTTAADNTAEEDTDNESSGG